MEGLKSILGSKRGSKTVSIHKNQRGSKTGSKKGIMSRSAYTKNRSGGEGEREGGRETGRERQGERETGRERQGERERERERERECVCV